MARLSEVGDLHVPEDIARERRAYRVRGVFAVVGLLILAAALLGLVGGSGPLSETSVRTAGGDLVSYERFVRAGRETRLEVEVARGSGETHLALSGEYLEDMELVSVSVQPDTVRPAGDRVVFTWDLTAPATISFNLRPDRMGVHRATVWGPGDRPAELTQFAYP